MRTGRPPQPTIMSGLDRCGQAIDVIATTVLYAVCYDGTPIGVRQHRANNPLPRYPKSVFPTPGHARQLAARLNAAMTTDLFGVRRLVVADDE